ncbi:mitogen-activated protein kinase kinase 10 [Salvia miltiorrhiza]|uniref:mitogen-activated protein kinase kinase 10 n=1 Tax=Salvia miltiorrhiza TaxID=226208 RepID=UPI0025AD6F8A|nr:mitogen-activated protein kinase kinase 10 [Salvia miltiorrhiza]
MQIHTASPLPTYSFRDLLYPKKFTLVLHISNKFLMRERRHQQVLRLTLPPPGLSLNPSPLSSASRSTSPGISELKKLSVLGRGSGGTVYKVSHKQTGAIYALKVVRGDQDDDDDLEAGAREAEILRRVDSSEHVVRYVGVFNGGLKEVEGGVGGGGGLCLVMEYMDAGSLHDILRRKKRLPEHIISGVVKSVLKGLQYLHGLGIVHGDVKPSNLLVNTRGQVKLADFGAAAAVRDGAKPRTRPDDRLEVHGRACRGTCPYMSPERMDPEMWDGERCDGYAGDVWSLGVVAMECYVGRFPLVGPGQKLDWVTLMCAVCFGDDVERMVKMGSPEFESFCRRCLERHWRRRGTADELLLHPFLDKSQTIGIDHQDIISYINLSEID